MNPSLTFSFVPCWRKEIISCNDGMILEEGGKVSKKGKNLLDLFPLKGQKYPDRHKILSKKGRPHSLTKNFREDRIPTFCLQTPFGS